VFSGRVRSPFHRDVPWTKKVQMMPQRDGHQRRTLLLQLLLQFHRPVAHWLIMLLKKLLAEAIFLWSIALLGGPTNAELL
jgi:hypothetical protein